MVLKKKNSYPMENRVYMFQIPGSSVATYPNLIPF